MGTDLNTSIDALDKIQKIYMLLNVRITYIHNTKLHGEF